MAGRPGSVHGPMSAHPIPGVSLPTASGASIPVQVSVKGAAQGFAGPTAPDNQSRNVPRLISQDEANGMGPVDVNARVGRPTAGQTVTPRQQPPQTPVAVIMSVDGDDYYHTKQQAHDARMPELAILQTQVNALAIALCEIARGANPQQAANHVLSQFKFTIRDMNGKVQYDHNMADTYGKPIGFPEEYGDSDPDHTGHDGISIGG